MKKVLCAISGGVDSSVSAYLLKNKGYFDVQGAFIRFFDSEKSRLNEKKAEEIAKKIGIPFHVFDFRKEFEKEIIDYFVEGYRKGITPNPCVVCNKKMKFGLFLEKAEELQMDFIATGHYAVLEKKNDQFFIKKGKDKKKDQSYFLWQLNQEQLKRVLFPLGHTQKKEVQKKAQEASLLGLISKESQDICFINKTAKDFLKKRLGNNPGKIINSKKKILGEHEGLWFYTIGQRKRIKLPGGPFYVLKKDFENNYLVVTRDRRKLLKGTIQIKDVNWISGEEPDLPLRCDSQVRYGSESVPVTIHKKDSDYFLGFDQMKKSVSLGQSAVFYRREVVLGGGIIC